MINPIIRSTVLDQNLKLLIGSVLNAKVLEIIGSKHAVLDIDGKRVTVTNETNLVEDEQIKIEFRGTDIDGKLIFRIVNQGSSEGMPSDELFLLKLREFKIPATPSLISKIKEFSHTDSSNIEQILLLAKKETALSTGGFRIWNNFWNEETLLENLEALRLNSISSETEAADAISLETESLETQSARTKSTKAESLVEQFLIKPSSEEGIEKDITNLEIAFRRILKAKTTNKLPEAIARLETDSIDKLNLHKVVEQLTAEALLNKILHQDFPNYFYFQIPLFYENKWHLNEMLIQKEAATKSLKVTLQLKTKNLNDIFAVLHLIDQKLELTFYVANREIAGVFSDQLQLFRQSFKDSPFELGNIAIKYGHAFRKNQTIKREIINLMKSPASSSIDITI